MNPFANEFLEHANDILFWIISKMVASKQAHLSQRQRERDQRGKEMMKNDKEETGKEKEKRKKS